MVNVTHDVEIGVSSLGRSVPMGYALWEYTETGWNLRKNAAVPGAIPSPAPRAAGQFIGQIRAIPCVAATQSW